MESSRTPNGSPGTAAVSAPARVLLAPRLRPFLAVIPPLIALLIHLAFAPLLEPHVWFLFYPAIFISSWIGGRRSALAATVLTTVAVWWVLVPPRYAAAKSAGIIGPAVFFSTGILFALFHQRLRATNARLRQAVDDSRVFKAFLANSSDFIGIANPNGQPLYLNPAGRQMVGLDADFDVGPTEILDYYAHDQRAFASSVILKSMIDHGQWKGDTSFRHWQTNEAIPVSDTHFMIREPETGRLLGMGTVTRDVSEVKQAREEIERTNRRLAQANEEITVLYRKVSKLDELKTQFFANVSHELRTPLTLILSPVQKHLRSGTLDDGLREDLQVVERNARTVLQHVNDLLDVARLTAGRLSVEYAAIDAAVLVREMTGHFSAVAMDHGCAFTVDAPSALPIESDPDKLQRMLLNLLSNAFKFTPAGGRVRVSLVAEGARFRIEVADSGPGVPAEQRETVFERFRQLAGDSERTRRGTGLGLSIVRDFAMLLDGEVTVADAPEGGALFVLDLPSVAPPGTQVALDHDERHSTHDIEHVVDGLRNDRAHVVEPGQRPHGKGRVLVVEDNVDLSRFIGDTLRKAGFDVLSAFDGQEGYEKTLSERPDLVLADLMMPRMTGEQLVRLLRRQSQLNALPIVILSARTDEDLRVRLLREGAQDYLDKPFSVPELLARVGNLVARKQADDYVSRLTHQLEAIAAASTQISEAVAGLPEDSVRTVLQMLALHARNLTRAELAAAGIRGDPAAPIAVWATAPPPGPPARVDPAPRPAALLDLIWAENRTVRIEDLQQHPLWGSPQESAGIRGFLGVPIRHGGRAIGSLYLANRQGGGAFTVEDQQLVETLAARAGSSVEIARLYSAEGRARSWLQAVVDQMPEGIILMDAAGRVTMENQSLQSLTHERPAARDRFGNTVTIDLQRPSGELLGPDESPIVKALLDRKVTHGQELIGRRADGRLVPLFASATPIVSASGELAGAVMVLQDITVLKELESLREEWASIVAHDLRQPITVISLRSSLIMQDNLTEEQQDDAKEIKVAAQRLNRMASDLMDASLLETHRMHLALDRLDLCQLLRDVVTRVPLAALQTMVQVPRAQLFVEGDAQRLEQVLENLLSNAVKYGAPDAPIVVEARALGAEAEIVVANHGDGIAPEEIPILFNRFFRSHTATHSGVKGLGLGLYIVRGLVEAHGGRIWVDSVPGDVTTFHVTLPLADETPVKVKGQRSKGKGQVQGIGPG